MRKCIYVLGGASLGTRKDIPRPAFGTGGGIQHQPCLFEGRAGPEDLEDGPRRAVRVIAPRCGGCEDSPGVPRGFEFINRGTGGGFKDDRVENVAVGSEGEIHDRQSGLGIENGYQGVGVSE